MLTANGLPIKRTSHGKLIPQLTKYSDNPNGDDDFLSFIGISTQLYSSECCKKKYVCVLCSSCGMSVNVPINSNIILTDYDKCKMMRIISRIHFHKYKYENLLWVGYNSNDEYIYCIDACGRHIFGDYILEDGGNNGLPENITCPMCDGMFYFTKSLHIISRQERLNIFDLYKDMNYNYRMDNHCCCVNSILSENNASEIKEIYDSVTNYTNALFVK